MGLDGLGGGNAGTGGSSKLDMRRGCHLFRRPMGYDLGSSVDDSGGFDDRAIALGGDPGAVSLSLTADSERRRIDWHHFILHEAEF